MRFEDVQKAEAAVAEAKKQLEKARVAYLVERGFDTEIDYDKGMVRWLYPLSRCPVWPDGSRVNAGTEVAQVVVEQNAYERNVKGQALAKIKKIKEENGLDQVVINNGTSS